MARPDAVSPLEVDVSRPTKRLVVPLIIEDGDEVFRCEHEGEALTGVESKIGIAASLGIRAAAGRSWPAERLDLIVRQMFADVEETLLAVRDLIEP